MTGKLIVFEGIDGSGTTTQAARLHRALLEMHLPVHLTEEPSKGPIGSLIQQILHGRLVSLGISGTGPPSWATMALLFAADRLDHCECEIDLNLRDGINVISDRYVYSSIVYQTVTSGDEANLEWIRTLNRFARRADLVIFLDTDPEEARRRRFARRIGHELYDDFPLQVKLAEKYREVMGQIKEEKVAIIDGNMGIEEVAERCLAAVKDLLKV